MREYSPSTIHTRHNLTCSVTDAHATPPPVLDLVLHASGPNHLARGLISQLLDVADDYTVRCQDCQAQVEASPSPSVDTEPTFDERLALTRAAIARIADLWGCSPQAVDVSVRDASVARFAEAVHHPEAQPSIVGRGKLTDTWVTVRFKAGDSTRNLSISMYHDHDPAIKAAFGGHWPQAFVPHEIVPSPDNGALCATCTEPIGEHVAAPGNGDKREYVWSEHAPTGFGSVQDLVATRDSGDGRKVNDFCDQPCWEGGPPCHLAPGHPTQHQPHQPGRVPYANSMADTASSATSN